MNASYRVQIFGGQRLVTARFTDPDVGSRIEVKDEGSFSNMAGRLVRFLKDFRM